MLRITLLIYAICCITVSKAQSTKVDQERASVTFVFLDGEVEGTLSNFKFEGSVDLNDMRSSLLKGSVETKTLDTDNWLRSRHLRSRKYFASKAHPRLSFESLSIVSSGSTYKVEGNLTIKGISRSVILEMDVRDDGLLLSGMINTQDFDIDIYEDSERNKVRFKVVIPLVEN